VTKINHSRWELVLRDNLARELGKSFEATQRLTDDTWPSELRPLGQSDKAKVAVFNLLELLGEAFDREGYVEKRQAFQKAATDFLAARAYDPYDNQLTIEGWL
jgi:hypothetical protein